MIGLGFITEIAIIIIVLAIVFAIVGMFITIDERIKRIMWLVVAGIVAIVLIEWLVSFTGGGGLTFRH